MDPQTAALRSAPKSGRERGVCLNISNKRIRCSRFSVGLDETPHARRGLLPDSSRILNLLAANGKACVPATSRKIKKLAARIPA